jgi:hypothetical protein
MSFHLKHHNLRASGPNTSPIFCFRKIHLYIFNKSRTQPLKILGLRREFLVLTKSDSLSRPKVFPEYTSQKSGLVVITSGMKCEQIFLPEFSGSAETRTTASVHRTVIASQVGKPNINRSCSAMCNLGLRGSHKVPSISWAEVEFLDSM